MARQVWRLHGHTLRVTSTVPLPPLLEFALRRHARRATRAAAAVDLVIRQRAFTPPRRTLGTAVWFARPVPVRGELGPRRYWLRAGAGGVCGDLLTGRTVVDVPDGAWLAEPSVLRTLLPLALTLPLARFGWFVVHAAVAVDPAGHGWLLCGGSGAGKSTTLFGLLCRGWRYLGDDAVLLRRTRQGVEALGFWDELRLDRALARRFSPLRFVDLPADHPTKAIVDVDAVAADAYRPRVMLRHLVLLTRDHRRATEVPGAALYLSHLIAENAVLLVHAPRRQLDLLARLLQTCRAEVVAADARLLENPAARLVPLAPGDGDRGTLHC